ncbi:MAG: BrnT family toxin [Anaerolineae bacterium]|nr:BrnT family toxin [Anaerolineae bacterium]
MSLEFEWDAKKAARNRKKHKVSFEEAQTVFEDETAYTFPDELHSTDEDREIIIGHSSRNRLLLVCFVERILDVIRIFSARRATENERADYEENAGIKSSKPAL